MHPVSLAGRDGARSGAAALDPSRQFPICQPEPLTALFRGAGLRAVTVEAIEIPTTFRDFDDYWRPHS